MDRELKPCPFCGSPARQTETLGLWSPGGYGPPGINTVCSNTKCTRVAYGHGAQSKSADAWNTRAALRPEAQGVKVRKLEWVPLGDKWNTHTSGRMQITQRGCIPHWDLSCASPEADGYYDTLEAAKAAAQADYEARILSALDRPEAQDGVASAAKVLADACVQVLRDTEFSPQTRRDRIIRDIGSSCFNNLRALQQDGGK